MKQASREPLINIFKFTVINVKKTFIPRTKTIALMPANSFINHNQLSLFQ
jgi:hypothetical protein